MAVDLVNIRSDFVLLGSNSKPAVGEFKSLLAESCTLSSHKLNSWMV